HGRRAVTDRRSPAEHVQVLGDAVLLTGDAVRHTLLLVATANRRNRLSSGHCPSPAATAIEAALTTAARRQPSTAGQVDVHHTDDESWFDCEPIDAATAATILGCTRRSVYRLAPSLDGRKVAGHWMFDRTTVTAYSIESRKDTTHVS
ncbi:hypothetical protein, partial [Bacillus safensis]|uniref:hypothetical protein n=1 Tax=Bacillus safensis TaxID=561879 RepID=UPI003659E0B6